MMPPRSGLTACLLSYLLLNGLLSGVALGVERSNIPKAIAWLRAHGSEEDLILSFRSELALHGGEALCARTVSIVPDRQSVSDKTASKGYGWIRRDARSPWLTGEEIQGVLTSRPSSTVYFLYTDAYRFRNWLYERTTGRPQPVQRSVGYYNLFEILTRPQVSEAVGIPGLRECGLRRVDRKKLLQELAAGGFI